VPSRALCRIAVPSQELDCLDVPSGVLGHLDVPSRALGGLLQVGVDGLRVAAALKRLTWRQPDEVGSRQNAACDRRRTVMRLRALRRCHRCSRLFRLYTQVVLPGLEKGFPIERFLGFSVKRRAYTTLRPRKNILYTILPVTWLYINYNKNSQIAI